MYGDSNCLDSSHMVTNCYWLLRKMLDFTGNNLRDPILFADSAKQDTPLLVDDDQLPSRRTDINFLDYSRVAGKQLICRSDSRFELWGTKGYTLQGRGRNRKLPGYPDSSRGVNSSQSRHPKLNVKSKGDSSGNRYLGLFYGEEVKNKN